MALQLDVPSQRGSELMKFVTGISHSSEIKIIPSHATLNNKSLTKYFHNLIDTNFKKAGVNQSLQDQLFPSCIRGLGYNGSFHCTMASGRKDNSGATNTGLN